MTVCVAFLENHEYFYLDPLCDTVRDRQTFLYVTGITCLTNDDSLYFSKSIGQKNRRTQMFTPTSGGLLVYNTYPGNDEWG